VKRHRWSGLLTATILVTLVNCIEPVDTSNRNLLVLERIWQYASVYSIYQENVPTHKQALEASGPQEILDSLHDTLYSHTWDTVLTYAEYQATCAIGPAAGGIGLLADGTDATVYYTKLTPTTAYLRISQFDDSTSIQLKQIVLSRVTGLIVDVLDNPGGNLDAVTECLDILLPEDRAYLARRYRQNVVNDGGFGATINDTLKAQPTADSLDFWKGKAVVVLINRMSASAAEILAVGLRDGLGPQATLMGETSFGKAIGQYIFCFFSARDGVEVTGFRFHRLSGQDYHEVGIAPDVALSPGSDRDWIIAAGQRLETNFLNHLTPGILDIVIRYRGSLKKQTSAQSYRPACYKRIYDVPEKLF
jgi:hypothetical protein